MFLHDELSMSFSGTREANLSKALSTLNALERKAIFLRFWNPCTILEISKTLKMSWEETDRFIECTLQKLKQKIIEIEKGESEV